MRPRFEPGLCDFRNLARRMLATNRRMNVNSFDPLLDLRTSVR